MDKIYLSAALTIVSGDGTHANTGLTGFAPNSRPSAQNLENIAGLRFVSVGPSAKKVLQNLYWFNRAWTYQEFMLSKRLMIFTDRQLFYFCNLRNFCEDSKESSPIIYFDRPSPITFISDHPLWDVDQRHQINGIRQVQNSQNSQLYKPLVQEIMSRQITNDADILRSVVGIFKVTSEFSNEKFICGLPASQLEWALFWQPDGTIFRRGNTYSGQRFPSWSWAGWTGAIKYPNTSNPDAFAPLISDWQFLTPSTSSSSFLPYHPNFVKPDGFFWEATTWKSDIPSDPHGAEQYQQHQIAVQEQEPLIETGILTFTADTAVLNIETSHVPYRYPGFSVNLWRIINPITNQWVGTMNLGHVNPASAGLNVGNAVQAELVAIWKTQFPWDYLPGLPYNAAFDVAAFRSLDINSPTEPLMVNVMWVRWYGNVATRVATGQIHIDAWAQIQTVRKKIRLG